MSAKFQTPFVTSTHRLKKAQKVEELDISGLSPRMQMAIKNE